ARSRVPAIPRRVDRPPELGPLGSKLDPARDPPGPGERARPQRRLRRIRLRATGVWGTARAPRARPGKIARRRHEAACRTRSTDPSASQTSDRDEYGRPDRRHGRWVGWLPGGLRLLGWGPVEHPPGGYLARPRANRGGAARGCGEIEGSRNPSHPG